MTKKVKKNNKVNPLTKVIHESTPKEQSSQSTALTNRAIKFLKLTYSAYGILIAIFGGSVYSFFTPNTDLIVVNPAEQSLLQFALKNNSSWPIENVKTTMFIDKITAMDGKAIGRIPISNAEADYKIIDADETYSFNYDFGLFFGFHRPVDIFEASIGIEIKYDFLNITCTDYFFFQRRPAFTGKPSWVKMPKQNFIEEMRGESDGSDK